MYTVFKYIAVTIVSSNLILLSTNNYLCSIILFEVMWICFFLLCNMLGVFVGDCTGYCVGFIVLVLAACEMITLITLYLLDENN